MKKISLFFLTLCVITAGVFADAPGAVKGFDLFIQDLAVTLPDNAASTGTWSDAYIGQLFDSPLHLGVGVSAVATKLSVKGLNDAAKALGGSQIFTKDVLFLPGFAVEGRLGGIILPFDAGGKVAQVSNQKISLGGSDVYMSYRMWGADVRLPLLKEDKKSDDFTPDLSIGFSYTYLAGSFSADMKRTDAYFGPSDNTKLNSSFETHVYAGVAQMSKTIAFLTPYVGYRFLYSDESTGWTFGSKNGSAYNTFHISHQVFGGVSLDIFAVKITAGASYNVSTGNIGASANVRIQL